MLFNRKRALKKQQPFGFEIFSGKSSGIFLVTGTKVKAQLGPSVGTRRTPRVMVSQSIYA